MPSQSVLLADDKARIKASIPKNNKILTATVVRIFYQKGSEWVYSGVQGGLCLVVDKLRGGVWWRVVDLLGTRGIIWEHELPTTSTWSYNQDRGFFHTFASEETNVAFVFADEGEAGEMWKKVQARGKYNKPKKAVTTSSAPSSSKKKKGGKIDKSLISGPSEGSFQHIAHMGYTAETGFSSSGVDPSWQALLDSLSSQGVSQKQIMENEGFIKDFVQKKGGPPPVEPKKRPPPPAPTSKRKAPPPPPPSRQSIQNPPPSTPSRAQPPPPPPSSRVPPPVAQPEGYDDEPEPPSRAPPPPPPPPPGRGAPPAPPVPGRSPAAPEMGSADIPTVTPPRANLLASIQGAGLANLKKTSASSSDASSPSRGAPPPPSRTAPMAAAAVGGAAVVAGGTAAAVAAEESSSGGGGGDLASALASALSQRKGNMGDSDEESDDEWD